MVKKDLRKIILHRLFGKIFRACMVYMGLVIVCLIGGIIVCSMWVWYGTEPLYEPLNWIADNVMIFGLLMFVLGFFGISLFYWYRLLGYFQQVLTATEQMYTEKHRHITLPEELKEVEYQMNAIQDEVRESLRMAKEAEQRKNDLVVYLAHDLKTPLTSVLGYLTLLHEEQEISPKLRERYLKIGLDKAERLEFLINEFFEITRFNLTSMELEKSSINFTRMLEQIVFEFQPMLAKKRLTCRLLAEPDILLRCDPDKMQRVIDNLLRNGILYGYEGTKITLELRMLVNNRLELICQNHGPTIPKEKLERIFQQFYRLDSSRSSGTGGSGLGLAIAKEIIRLHNGEIRAESENELTSFIVELPRF